MEYALGVFVSLVVEGVKHYSKERWSTFSIYSILALLSILVGVVYVMFADTPYWRAITQVIVTASAFHNLVLRRLEK